MALNRLIRMHVSCGRMGNLCGLFICTEEEFLPFVQGRAIYFGEVLGKHSEIEAEIKVGKTLEVISIDQDLIDRLLGCFSGPTLSGENPVIYLRDQEEAARECDE